MSARATLATLRPAADAPASAWATRISACWRASVEAILEVGRLLTAAKEALPHGEFGKMIESELPFGDRTARMLMAIAADPRLTDRKHAAVLPASWATLYELHTLDDAQFQARLADGTIRPDMERKEVFQVRRDGGMAQRVQAAGDLDFAPTPPWATRALMERALPQIRDVDFDIAGQSAWEPACGEGHMADVLAEYFRLVKPSDVHDYGYGDRFDFLEGEHAKPGVFDWIITNPPFDDKAEAFALRALALAKVGVAIFAQLRWLETIGRYERLFEKHPPTLLAFFAERVPLCMGRWEPDGTTATAYMWVAWVKGRVPQAPFWIPPGCREALTRPDDRERFTAHPVIRKPHADLALPADGSIPAFLRRSA
jgi:hypothetical protein